MENLYFKAQSKYKPDSIKYLIVAESPPNTPERYFYYEDVRKHDYVFTGIISVLYPERYIEYMELRKSKDKTTCLLKEELLCDLKKDGFYLIDVSEEPLDKKGKTKTQVKNQLKKNVPNLISRIETIVKEDTKILMLTANVYDIINKELKLHFENQVIDKKIPFPGVGHVHEFRPIFKSVVEE